MYCHADLRGRRSTRCPRVGQAMKILHIAQKLPGGIATYLSEILPAQVRLFGEENVLVLGSHAELSAVPECASRSRRVFPDSSRSLCSLIKFFWMAGKVVYQDKPDVIHLHSSFAGALRPIFFALSMMGIRPAVVYCAHGWSFNMTVSQRRRRLFAFLERVLAPMTDVIVNISNFEFNSALSWGLPAARMRVIRNGVAVDVPPKAFEMEPKGCIHLLFIGRLDRQKGIDILQSAMRRLAGKSLHLHVIGTSVLSNSRHRQIEPNISYYGWLSRIDVRSFIASCDVVVMPSRWEGFGLVAIEAMRDGKPVIASNVDALPEIIGDTGIIFESEDDVALTRVLDQLNPDRLREIGQHARNRFLAHFTCDRLVAELFECYDHALELRHPTKSREF